jgi:hypothetical protein
MCIYGRPFGDEPHCTGRNAHVVPLTFPFFGTTVPASTSEDKLGAGKSDHIMPRVRSQAIRKLDLGECSLLAVWCPDSPR